jgi:hypothetical protein
MSDDWWDAQTAEEAAPATPPQSTRAVKRPFKPEPIPAADAWLIFRATDGDGSGILDHAEDFRVVRGRDLNALERRGEPRDWTHDIPLLRASMAPAHWMGGDPGRDAHAAWRVFCREWKGVGTEHLREIAKVAGMEWAAEMAARQEAA